MGLLDQLRAVPNLKYSEYRPGYYHVRFFRQGKVYAHWYPTTGKLFLGSKADHNTYDTPLFDLAEVLQVLRHAEIIRA